MNSELWKLSKSDIVHGLLVAVATAVLTLLLQMLSSGQIDWRQLGLTAVGAALAYLLKQLSTDENGKVMGKL